MTIQTDQIITDITLCITSNLDIATGLKETRHILSQSLPLSELILFSVNRQNRRLQFLIRVGETTASNNENLSSFLLQTPDEVALREKMTQQSGTLHTYRRATLEKEFKIQIDKYLIEAGALPSADLLMLFDSSLHTGLIAIALGNHAFTDAHHDLFERLKMPFRAAMVNALQYSKAAHMRDALADDNLLFREATIRLTGETDIPEAFHSTFEFLKQTVDLQQMLLITMNEDLQEQRILLRVDDTGPSTVTESLELFKVGEKYAGDVSTVRKELEQKLPNVFISNLRDTVWQANLKYFSFFDRLEELGISPDATTIVLGAKNIRSGVLFVFKPSVSTQRCLHVIETLKEPFVISLRNAIRLYTLEAQRNRLAEENRALLYEMQQEVGDRVIGMHGGLRVVMTLVTQVAKRPSPVLIVGETGTGKEVIASAIHRLSERSAAPFISINCGAIPETLVDSELFGHEKGAFTGANERKRGRFERADGGTLFLDEIGELPASAQVKLLRVLQEKEFERVGGSQIIRANARLIAATNRDLPQMVRDGQFREDLFFRLNVFPIHIPPLRHRLQDIPTLAYYFIESKIRQLNLPFRPALPPAELQKLIEYSWPGNVRELQNAIERALILSRGEPLHFSLLTDYHNAPSSDAKSPCSAPAEAESEDFPSYRDSQKAYFKKLLKKTNGKIAGQGGAADISGMNPSTLRSKLKKLKLDHNGD
ncbi:MAG: sigma 54-interacting transcriptional regulator [Deltaproteobacteria bacterium]|nr:sigma 54-interacting transcriptional regulator [Deltaproteobacteria bacterium]